MVSTLTTALIFLSGFQCGAAPAKAPKTCGTVDLASRFGPVHSISASWCSSTVAADLLSDTLGLQGANRISIKDVMVTNQSLSDAEIDAYAAKQPTWKAANAYEHYKTTMAEYRNRVRGQPMEKRNSYLGRTIAAYSIRGQRCSTKQVPNPDAEVLRDASFGADPDQFINQEDDAAKALRDALVRGEGPIDLANPKLSPDEFSCQNGPAWLRGFAQIRGRLNDWKYELARNEIESACQPRVPFKAPVSELYDKPKDIIDALKTHLDHGVAGGIEFDSAILLNPPVHDQHSAIIVGKRWNAQTATCEFEIRNSWGKDCYQYPPPYNRATNCSQGNVWVPEETLKANVSRATFLKKSL